MTGGALLLTTICVGMRLLMGLGDAEGRHLLETARHAGTAPRE